MQQRQLRLGDILDDYCPRERRLANHTIVAMVGDEVRLTRCTTCDSEHPYKGGKMPRLRKKKTSVAAAYDQVLESVPTFRSAGEPGTRAPEQEAQQHAEEVRLKPAATGASPNGDAPPSHSTAGAALAPPAADALGTPAAAAPEEVRLHRPLIRAQLPRIERDAAARPAPEFTIHQTKRHGRFQGSRPARFAKAGGPVNRQGNPRGLGGPPGARQAGRPQGHGSPARPHHGRPGHHSGGKKRSR